MAYFFLLIVTTNLFLSFSEINNLLIPEILLHCGNLLQKAYSGDFCP